MTNNNFGKSGYDSKKNSFSNRDGSNFRKFEKPKFPFSNSKSAPKTNFKSRTSDSFHSNEQSNDKRKFELKDNNNEHRPYNNYSDRNNQGTERRYNSYSDRNSSGTDNRSNYYDRNNAGQERHNNYSDRNNQGTERRYNSYSDRNSSGTDNRSNYYDRNNSGQDRRNNYSDRNNSGTERHYNNYSDRNNSGSDNRFSSYDKRPNLQLNKTKPEFSGSRFNSDRSNDSRPYPPKRVFLKDDNYDANAKYSQKKKIEYAKAMIDPSKPVRLNKFLANAGICSRREADEYIEAGVITVNGEVVNTLGYKVLPSDKVMFHNQSVHAERRVYLLLNKPKDCITTAEDTEGRTTVLDIVKNACSERIYPVGRLDRNTTGVLLLTNDGELATQLTHPKYNKKKIYNAVLDRDLTPEDALKITTGLQLDEDTFISADALDFASDDDRNNIGIEIHSGQNRIVRRIFESLGYRVVRLDRVYFAGLTKKNLPRGKYRFLNQKEINMLKMGAYA
jgi:23S rRNA pseudouridine2605 synthase